MKVRIETADDALATREMRVGITWRGNVEIAIGEKTVSFLPGHAVEIWRVLQGEKEAAEVPYVRHGLVDGQGKARIWYEEKTDRFRWKLGLSDGTRVVMDANEALAVAWAIEGMAPMSLWVRHVATESAPKPVWVLSSRRVLAGDCAETKESEMIGGGEEVFASRESATDNVREVLRVLVNEAYSESYWDNSERNVDDILDEIIDQCYELSGSTYWRHDGQTQSFEVKLSEREIRP